MPSASPAPLVRLSGCFELLMVEAVPVAEIPVAMSEAALQQLLAYSWPGNVRELRNVIERAVYRHEDAERPVDEIVFNPFHSPWEPTGTDTSSSPEVAPAAASESDEPVMHPPAPSTSDFRGAVAEYERRILEDALRRNRFNQRATAAALNLSYDQLRHALKRHKLQDSAA